LSINAFAKAVFFVFYLYIETETEGNDLIKLYNTMTRQKNPLSPIEKGKVRIFTCGPSIYRRPHIGNYRTFMYEDILVRLLEFSGFDVKRVINITDIEDKTISEALNRHEDMGKMTSGTADIFLKEADELSIKLPDYIPSSSNTIEHAALIIQKLIDKGHAYKYQGNVFFDPLTVKNFGRLYRLDMSSWPEKKVRFKRDTYNGNRWNKGDFILWHGDSGNHSNYWDSIIGRGRPSWNIQDPAIITKHLGEQVDINCGGIDNIYRHHDYNIAVMESLTGKEYAGIFLHGEHLKVNGQTMSKSRGNILYPVDIYAQGYTPQELRFLLAAGNHYRKKLNFTMELMEISAQRLRKIRKAIELLLNPRGRRGLDAKKSAAAEDMINNILPVFTSYLEDDLNFKDAAIYLEKSVEALEKMTMPDAALPEGLVRKLKESLEKIDSVACCLL
jgi:cysteinyl-tRNA synthetase